MQAKQEIAGKETRPAAAASSTKPTARGLTWRGCWGCSSSEIGIYVLATMVGHIHLQGLGEGNDAEYKAALQDVRRLLQESLPASAVLANVTWARGPQSSGRMAEVAIVGTSTACQRLQQQWQGKKLCGGLVVATWTSLNDTASEKHVERMAEMATKELRGPRRRTLALELPARWVEGQAPKQVNQLGPASQWYRFCALFGEVQTLELVRPTGSHGNAVQLLISYKEPEYAGAFREALTDRYLIFVNSSIPDDCYPVSCVPGDGYSLREYFCSGASREKKAAAPPAAAAAAPVAALGAQTPRAAAVVRDVVSSSATGGFLLRRCGHGEVPGALRPAPETFPISKTRLDFGREDTCDVVLRHQHVSKVHAVFVLQTLPEGAGDMLLMQDASSNGTWINGTRMTQGRFHQLQPGDRVSFLQPSSSLEEDVATWQVVRDASVKATAAPAPAKPAQTAPAPLPAAAKAAPEKPVEKPPVRKKVEEKAAVKVAAAAALPEKPVVTAQKVAAKKPATTKVVEAAPAAPKVKQNGVPEAAPAEAAPPKGLKRKAPQAEPPKAKPMPLKRHAEAELAEAPPAARPSTKVVRAAKTQARKPSRMAQSSPAVSPQDLAAGYAALAAAYAQAAAEEEAEGEAAAAEPMAPAPSSAAPLLSPPWRSSSMQLPPPPKRPEVVPQVTAAEAAGQVLSAMRQLQPKSRPTAPSNGGNGYDAMLYTPYLDMPRGNSFGLPPAMPAMSEVNAELASNDIAEWVRAWKLEQYEDILLRNYDDVEQIVSVCLDTSDLMLFFDDNHVQDEADRLTFTHAIQGRQALIT